MSLNHAFINTINEYIDVFCSTIATKHNISKESLLDMWSNISIPVSSNTSANTIATPASSPVTNTTNSTMPAATVPAANSSTAKFTNEQIATAGVAQLKAFCKSCGLPVGGKKQELIDRLINSQTKDPKTNNDTTNNTKTAPETNPATEITKTKKKKRSPNRMPSIPISSIQIKKNSFGNYEHPETKLIFDKQTKQVYGRQLDSGVVQNLTEHDIELCDQFKFTYRLPETLSESKNIDSLKDISNNGDPIVETLDEIIGSDEEEDFEEFYEKEDN